VVGGAIAIAPQSLIIPGLKTIAPDRRAGFQIVSDQFLAAVRRGE